MTIEERRAAAAEFMGWYQDCNPVENWWCMPDGMEGKLIVSIKDYTPDTNLEQADDLKARLRELKYEYILCWDEKEHRCEIENWNGTYIGVVSCSKLSEGDALLDAIRKIPKEPDHD